MYFFSLNKVTTGPVPTAAPLGCKYMPMITVAIVFLWNRPVIQIIVGDSITTSPEIGRQNTKGPSLAGDDTVYIYAISSTTLQGQPQQTL